jgi:hypothetical protein
MQVLLALHTATGQYMENETQKLVSRKREPQSLFRGEYGVC